MVRARKIVPFVCACVHTPTYEVESIGLMMD